MQSIYLDNAATSFPKPAGVSDSMKQYLDCVGATINRSVYGRAQEAGLETLALRESLARLFRFPEPATHVVLTPGATFGLNLVIKGLLRPGDHCIVSGMEHNAVMRPLQQLEGVEFDRIPCDSEGFLQHGALEGLFRPNTRLVVLAHASNVCGSVQDAASVGAACARHGCFFLLDGAQTAGHYPIDFAALRLSALAVPGHKGLLGPSGIGALLLTDELAANLTPLVAGGTGSASDSELLPPYLPDRLESGTPNLPGIYGLRAALAFVEQQGVERLSNRLFVLGDHLQQRRRLAGAGHFLQPGQGRKNRCDYRDRTGIVLRHVFRDLQLPLEHRVFLGIQHGEIRRVLCRAHGIAQNFTAPLLGIIAPTDLRAISLGKVMSV